VALTSKCQVARSIQCATLGPARMHVLSSSQKSDKQQWAARASRQAAQSCIGAVSALQPHRVSMLRAKQQLRLRSRHTSLRVERALNTFGDTCLRAHFVKRWLRLAGSERPHGAQGALAIVSGLR
jgi:hypothetical protein